MYVKNVLVALLFAIIVLAGQAPCPANEPLAYYSRPHRALDRLAEGYARWMAIHRTQGGHHGWSEGRWQAALRATGGSRAAEITAETWPNQPNLSWEEQWAEYAKDWSRSRGQGGGANHWGVAGRRHRWIGTGSARGRNGTWYGCLIAVD